MSRLNDLVRFYALLDRLDAKLGGKRWLGEVDGRSGWPQRGVYFFFEDNEQRTESGEGPRVVRVGKHALKVGSRTTLWGRLSQHRGVGRSGGGNHRGSIFRLLIGTALKARGGFDEAVSWGVASDPGNAAVTLGTGRDVIRSAEERLERAVSEHIRAMPFQWLAIDDEPGPQSMRGSIERNSIALLSNWEREPLDWASANWLGLSCDRSRVKRAGIWNNNHVDEEYDPMFLQALEQLIA